MALSTGAPPPYAITFAAACRGYDVLLTYPSDLAKIPFDRSGTTHIGRNLIDPSLIAPDRIGASTSCVIVHLLATSRVQI